MYSGLGLGGHDAGSDRRRERTNIVAAVAAGTVSLLSSCVLPRVPAICRLLLAI